MLEAYQSSLHERVKNLEERLKANKPKSVEHQLQEKVCVISISY